MTHDSNNAVDFFGAARRELPPLFSPKQAAKLLPGLCVAGSIRNAIQQGRGPAHQRSGRRIVLERDSFLKWLLEKPSA